jgi:hypothetical protein
LELLAFAKLSEPQSAGWPTIGKAASIATAGAAVLAATIICLVDVIESAGSTFFCIESATPQALQPFTKGYESTCATPVACILPDCKGVTNTTMAETSCDLCGNQKLEVLT